MNLTHQKLVKMAAKWLQGRMPVVITELTSHDASATNEAADAIGFSSRETILVECKMSRSDFLADQKKFFRRRSREGMGSRRYYLTPPRMLKPEDLLPGWGLLEATGRGVREVIGPISTQEKNWTAEIRLLVSCLRRIGHDAPRGVKVRCYSFPEHETKDTATLGVKKDVEEKPVAEEA